MNDLVRGKRNLRGIQADVNSAFVDIKRPAIGPCPNNRVASKVGVRVFTVKRGVLYVGVAEGGDFAAGLEHVSVGVVVVVGVVGVADSKTPT